MDADPVWAAYAKPEAARTKRAPLQRVRLSAIPVASIPPRPWAYGSFLLFGQAACLAAIDGGGKGAIAVGIALSMITGRPLLGEKVWRTGTVAIVTYEDDQNEWQRRIAAACQHHELDYPDVLDRVEFLVRPRARIAFAGMEDGQPVFPDGDDIIASLKAMGAVLLIVDPLNHAHGFEDGNNNATMARVAAEMNRVADEAGVALLVLHHLRKGSTGQPDDMMGATSIRATFRSSLVLARMMPVEAEKMMIPDPWRYIRIAGTKENYTPPPEKSSWFKLIGVPLGNATNEYPDGDDIGVATIWQPRPMFEGMDASQLAAVFEALRQTHHSPSRQAKNWAGKVLTELGGRTPQEAAKIVAAWIGTGVLIESEKRDSKNRNMVKCVTVNDAKAAQILAETRALGSSQND